MVKLSRARHAEASCRVEVKLEDVSEGGKAVKIFLGARASRLQSLASRRRFYRARRAAVRPGRSRSQNFPHDFFWTNLFAKRRVKIMKPIHAFLLIAAFIVTGCDNVNEEQYRITGVSVASPDALKVKSILQSVADKTGLKDQTATSLVTNTLVFYTQPNVEHFRVDLGARFYRDDVLVDLAGGIGPTRTEFKQAKRLLVPALSAEFGSRFSIPQPFVPIPSPP